MWDAHTHLDAHTICATAGEGLASNTLAGNYMKSQGLFIVPQLCDVDIVLVSLAAIQLRVLSQTTVGKGGVSI